MWSLFLLGLPILVVGAMDYDIPRKDVYKFPYFAYGTGRLGEMLNLKNMAKWCIFAFIQGLLLFTIAIRFVSGVTFVGTSNGYFTFDIYGVGMNSVSTGSGLGIYAEGFLLYTTAVVAMQYKVIEMAATPNWLFWLVWVASFAGYLIFTSIYGLFPSIDWYLAMEASISHPIFWLAIFLVPLTLVISDYMISFVFSQFNPSSRDELVNKLDTYYREHPEEAIKERKRYEMPPSPVPASPASTSAGSAFTAPMTHNPLSKHQQGTASPLSPSSMESPSDHRSFSSGPHRGSGGGVALRPLSHSSTAGSTSNSVSVSSASSNPPSNAHSLNQNNNTSTDGSRIRDAF
jgi:uncharacterized membrane protein